MILFVALVLLLQPQDDKISKVRGDVASLRASLGAYEVDTGRVPTTEAGLAALLTAPPGSKNWKGPYTEAKELPKDPWGNPYVYRSPGVKYTGGYDLFSAGPDGKPYTADDVWK